MAGDKMRKIHCEEELKGTLDDMSITEVRKLAGFYEPEVKGKHDKREIMWEVSKLFDGVGYTAKNQFEAETIASLEMIKGMLLKLLKEKKKVN